MGDLTQLPQAPTPAAPTTSGPQYNICAMSLQEIYDHAYTVMEKQDFRRCLRDGHPALFNRIGQRCAVGAFCPDGLVERGNLESPNLPFSPFSGADPYVLICMSDKDSDYWIRNLLKIIEEPRTNPLSMESDENRLRLLRELQQAHDRGDTTPNQSRRRRLFHEIARGFGLHPIPGHPEAKE